MVFPAGAPGQAPAESAPRAEVAVSGTVIDATTGLPIANAVVECGGTLLESPGRAEVRKARTGPDGRFSFERVPEGSAIRVWRRGYRTAGDFNEMWTREARRNSGPLTVALVQLGVVTGRVTDENGDPIMGLTVQLLKADLGQGKWRTRQHAAAVTDDRGIYRLWHLSPGFYYLKVMGRNRIQYGIATTPSARPGILSFGPQFFPSGATLKEAQRIRVEPGGTLQADFVLHGRRGFTIRGQIHGAPPDTGVNLHLLRGGEVTGHSVRVDQASGLFEIIGVAPGDYLLTARADAEPARYARVPVKVGEADLAGVAVRLQPGAQVTFTLRDRQPLDRFSSVTLLAEDDRPGEQGEYSAHGEISPGVLRIEGVPPGRYRVQWQGLRPAASLRSGTVDLFQEPLDVTESGCEPVEVLLAEPGRLEVAVAGLDGEQDAIVLAVRNDFPLAPYSMSYSISGRTVKFDSLAPGLYRIFAYLSETPFAFNEPGVVQSVADQAAVVEVRAGATERVAVKLLKMPEGVQER